MFTTIFKYELRYWLTQPSVYLYFTMFFLFSMMGMGEKAGMWDDHQNQATSVWIANSPYKILSMFEVLNRLILLLLPTIIGLSVYRDFKSNMHRILYSYPFKKPTYLFAKFLSSFLVLVGIVSAIGLGIFAGTCLPNVNPSLLAPFNWSTYLFPYIFVVLPNILLFGAIVFGVVLFSRNIYAGFIVVVLLLFVQGLIGTILGGFENQFWGAVLDPFAQRASIYYCEYWTTEEWNQQLLPVQDVLLYNRLIWLGISALIFGAVYRKFSFSRDALQFGRRKTKVSAALKASDTSNLDSITKIKLSNISFDFSFWKQVQSTWYLSNLEFNYIIKNWMFLSIFITGFLAVLFIQIDMNPQYGFKTLPVTWRLLSIPKLMFSGVIMLLTFLFAGMLIQRARIDSMNQLIDTTSVANWVLMGAKFLALIKMQAVLLSFILFGGLITQLYYGFHDFQIGLYLFDLYALSWITFIIWAFVAMLVQTVFTNPYLGTILLILGSMGVAGLNEFGVEHFVFRYNLGDWYEYSDMDGFGATLAPFFLYRFYWTLFGVFLLLGALCWWSRGIPHSFKERYQIAVNRLNSKTGLAMLLLLNSFFALGFSIYQTDNVANEQVNGQAAEDLWKANYEKKYKQFEKTPQPRIHDLKMTMDIFPETRDYIAKGEYLIVNETAAPIDTLLVYYHFWEKTSYKFNRLTQIIFRDTIHRLDMHILNESLAVGDSMMMNFTIQNRSNTFFENNSKVKHNGTYLTNNLFPGFGYQGIEIGKNSKRKKYGLPERDGSIPHPSDSTALYNNYSSKDTDWMGFEAIMSTSEDQIAIAPGYLQREWVENGRRYFYYKMDSKIKAYYGFNSGKFAVKKDQWNDVDLEVYYYPEHDYNLDRMLEGLKGSLAFNSANFSPYQHKQARIIEFPLTYGPFATTFANSVPFSEARFIVDVNDEDENSIDLPFYVAAHEMAHQWWGNQLIPANVLGSKMLTESMSEYSALKVLEKEYGKQKMRKFLEYDMRAYLRGRGRDTAQETPLMLSSPNKDYINYRKGALVMYAMSDYLGEDNFHRAIKTYLDKVKFQSAPYTTSLEMMDYIKAATPDSLQYLITDMYETITLYDNYIKNWTVQPLANGKFQVDIEFIVSKYRSEGQGFQRYSDEGGDSLFYKNETMTAPIYSLPLADYLEIGIFGEENKGGKIVEKELYLQKHKIDQINNRIRLIVDEKPMEVGIDPYSKLIDRRTGDNRRR